MKVMNSPSDRFLGRVKIRPLPMVRTIAIPGNQQR